MQFKQGNNKCGKNRQDKGVWGWESEKYKFYLHILLNSKFPISADKRVNINHCKLNTNMNATLFFVLSLFKCAKMYLFITEFIVMILVIQPERCQVYIS